jgi:thiosulfate/3-mercaptopyruvate sulfurtransferase
MILKEFIRAKGVVAFKVMGHEKVWVLDGGLPAWIKAMLLKKDRNNYMKKGDFTANFQPQLFKTKEQVLENIQTKEALLVDADLPIVFLPKQEEPRAGLRSGHIQFNKYSLYATTERQA